jgi:hypothetical protein
MSPPSPAGQSLRVPVAGDVGFRDESCRVVGDHFMDASADVRFSVINICCFVRGTCFVWDCLFWYYEKKEKSLPGLLWWV